MLALARTYISSILGILLQHASGNHHRMIIPLCAGEAEQFAAASTAASQNPGGGVLHKLLLCGSGCKNSHLLWYETYIDRKTSSPDVGKSMQKLGPSWYPAVSWTPAAGNPCILMHESLPPLSSRGIRCCYCQRHMARQALLSVSWHKAWTSKKLPGEANKSCPMENYQPSRNQKLNLYQFITEYIYI